MFEKDEESESLVEYYIYVLSDRNCKACKLSCKIIIIDAVSMSMQRPCL